MIDTMTGRSFEDSGSGYPTDSWRQDAACRDTDPDLFFPVGTSGPSIEQIETAKAVCRQCSAQVPCLEYALDVNIDHGIWGGTSEDERRGLRRQRRHQQREGGRN